MGGVRGVRVDLAGRRFGRLLIEGFSHAANRERFWNASCDCGARLLVTTWRLLNGHQKSCGCLRRDVAREKAAQAKDPRGRSFAMFYDRYRQSSRARGIAFTITREEFAELSIQPCHYCGSEPQARRHIHVAEPWIGNGLDRVDNDGGYELGNVVPCCFRCNRMKMDMTLVEFRDHVAKIHQRFQGLRDGDFHEGPVLKKPDR